MSKNENSKKLSPKIYKKKNKLKKQLKESLNSFLKYIFYQFKDIYFN